MANRLNTVLYPGGNLRIVSVICVMDRLSISGSPATTSGKSTSLSIKALASFSLRKCRDSLITILVSQAFRDPFPRYSKV